MREPFGLNGFECSWVLQGAPGVFLDAPGELLDAPGGVLPGCLWVLLVLLVLVGCSWVLLVILKSGTAL